MIIRRSLRTVVLILLLTTIISSFSTSTAEAKNTTMSSGSIQKVTGMPQKLYNMHNLISLPNNKVIMLSYDKLVMYDVTKKTWTTTKLPGMDNALTMSLLQDGTVLILGASFEKNNYQAYYKNLIFNPATKKVTAAPSIPTMTKLITQISFMDSKTLPNGTVLVTGYDLDFVRQSYYQLDDDYYDPNYGYLDHPYKKDQKIYQPFIYIYHPDQKNWTIPTELSHLGSISLVNSTGDYLNLGRVRQSDIGFAFGQVQRADTNHFLTTAPMPYEISDPGAAVLKDGTFFLTGGYEGKKASKKTAIYDADSNEWTSVAPLQIARGNAKAVILNDGHVLVASSEQESSSRRPGLSTEIYDPTSNTWSYGPKTATDLDIIEMVTLPSGQVFMLSEMGDFSYAHLITIPKK